MPNTEGSAAGTHPRRFTLRGCRVSELPDILRIINAAAQAYRGVIPADEWHEPYMSLEQLAQEIVAGVAFWSAQSGQELVGVMGVQASKDVDLIRHAYVLPRCQGTGVSGALLGRLVSLSRRPMLIGTWADASWAIRFYGRHGFKRVEDPSARAILLSTYWSIPEHHARASVVLTQ